MKNFETLCRAIENDDVCLAACTDKATGKEVAVVCAVNRVNGDFELAPIAKLFDGNPYDELNPPGDAGNGKAETESVRTSG